jgi:hypothetical protein
MMVGGRNVLRVSALPQLEKFVVDRVEVRKSPILNCSKIKLVGQLLPQPAHHGVTY